MKIFKRFPIVSLLLSGYESLGNKQGMFHMERGVGLINLKDLFHLFDTLTPSIEQQRQISDHANENL